MVLAVLVVNGDVAQWQSKRLIIVLGLIGFKYTAAEYALLAIDVVAVVFVLWILRREVLGITK